MNKKVQTTYIDIKCIVCKSTHTIMQNDRDNSDWKCKKCKKKILVSCNICNFEKYLIRQYGRSYENWLCASCRAKKLWQDKEYKSKRKAISSSNKHKKKLSENSKKLWEDEEYKKKHHIAVNNNKHKKKLSENSKKLWEDEEFRINQTETHKKLWENKTYRDNQIKIFQTDKYKEKQSEEHKKAIQKPEYIEKLSEKSKKLWKDIEYRGKMFIIHNSIEYREKMAKARSSQSGKVSSIQKILYSILDDLGVVYYREWEEKENDSQCRIGPYNFDCVIPRNDKSDLLIECQGDYWHSQEKAIRADQSKASYISNNLSHKYELKYLWEHEFSCKEKIIEVLKYWLEITKEELIDFSFSDVEIKKSKASEYKELLSKYHYLPNAGKGGKPFGAYLNNQLVAVCVFSSLVRQNIIIEEYKKEETIELSRLCIHPRYQKKNFGSWFVSRCIKQLDQKFKCIVSYCDTTFNHDGAIYKALNFKQDHVVKPDYWYVSEDGWVMHKKTLYNHAIKMKMKEMEYAEKNGYKRVYGTEKLRFIYER